MQATNALRRSGISKNMSAVVVAVVAAFLLGGAGGYLIKGLSLPVQTDSANKVIAQAGASDSGSEWTYASRRGGTQSVEGPAPIAQPSRTFHEPGTRVGGGRI